MAKPWNEFAATDFYRGLNPDEQQHIRGKYFDEVVAPNIGEVTDEELAHVRSVFDAYTQPKPSTAKEAGVLETARQSAVGLATGLGVGTGRIGQGAGELIQAPFSTAKELGLGAWSLAMSDKAGKYQDARIAAQQASADATAARNENMAGDGILGDVGAVGAKLGKTVEGAGKQYAKDAAAYRDIEAPIISRQMKNINDAEGFGGTVKSMTLDNPLGTVFGILPESAPDMALGMGIGKGVGMARAAAASARAEKAIAGIADGVKAGTIAPAEGMAQVAAIRKAAQESATGWAGEAAMLAEAGSSANSTRVGVKNKIEEMPVEELAKNNQRFRDLVSHGSSPEEARSILAQELSAEVALPAGAATYIGGKLVGDDVAMGKTLMGDRMTKRELAGRIGTEAAQEMLQSPGEDYAQYLAERQVDPNAKFDFGKSVGQGLVAGAAMGAGSHGTGYLLQGKDSTVRNPAPAPQTIDPNAAKAAEQASLDPARAAYDDLINQQRQVFDANQQALLGDNEVIPGEVQPANSFDNRFPAEPPRALTYQAGVPLLVFPDGSTMNRAEYEQRKAQQEQARLDGMIQDAPLPGMMARAKERSAPIEDAAELDGLVQSEKADKAARLKAEVARLKASRQTTPATLPSEQSATVPVTQQQQAAQPSVSPALTAMQQKYDAAKAAGDTATMGVLAPQINAEKRKAAQVPAEKQKASIPFSIGQTPANAEPVTVRNGVVHQGEYALEDYETGKPVTVPEGATHAQIRKAMEDAGQVPKGFKFFGEDKTAEVVPSQTPQQTQPRTRLTPIGDVRVANYSADLRSMAGDVGWAETGGRLLRDTNGNAAGRTSWLPHAEWFRAGMIPTPNAALAAVEKAIAGHPMTVKEKRTVQGMMDWLDHVNSQQAETETLGDIGYDELNVAEQSAVDTLGDLDIDSPQGVTDVAQQMRALGYTEEEIRAEIEQGNTRQGDAADEGNSKVEAQGSIQQRTGSGASEGRGQEVPQAEGLKLTGQTNAEAAAEFKRKQEEANKQENEAPAKNVTSDQVDLFNTQGGLFNSNRESKKKESKASTQANTDKIEDFGEKIGGAKKDLWTSFKDKLTEVSDDEIITQPLSKIWPEPDYQKMLDDGADSWAVAFIHSARDEIPRKPGMPWKQKRWAEQVKTLRSMASDVISGKTSVDTVRKELAKVSGLDKLASRIELYQLVGHSKSLVGIGFAQHHYSLYKGKENVWLWAVEQDAKATAFSNFPREIVTADTKADLLEKFKDKFASLDLGPAKKRGGVQFDIYSRKDNGFWIGKKMGRNPIWVAGPFATVGEARAYRDANNAELVAKLEKNKEIPNERRDTNNPRVGEDMRNGQDVTPKMFAESFGFKGVEFGNWVEQKKRQKDLNDAYDALMDMAAILGVPPKALSLNGELGLAFGARGSGGVNPAAAHYEQDKVVINLTKKEGAGSLGHEWWHALDNYFQRMRSTGSYATEALDVSLAARGSEFIANTAVRKEMIEAFGAVVKSIRTTSMKARSAKLDAKRSKEYWITGREMAARAFESYLISKLQDQNASNDYLANIVDEQTWAAAEKLGFELDGSYPYPTAGEMPLIRGAFEKFFQTIEHEPTEKGVRLFSKSRTASEDAADDLAALSNEEGNTPEQPVSNVAVRELSVPESPEIADMLGAELPDVGKAGVVSDIRTLPSATEATGTRMSRQTAEAIRFVAGLFGRQVVFYEATHVVPEGMNQDGNTIYVNVDGDVDALSVAGHEFGHSLEHTDPEAYNAAVDAIAAILDADPARAKAYAKYYNDPKMKGRALAKELLSDVTGNLWRDESFFKEMFAEVQRQHPHAEARSIITRLRDALVSFINKLISATSKKGFQLEENGLITREELVGIRERIVKMAAKAFIEEERARASGQPRYQGGKGNVRYSDSRLANDIEEITLEVRKLTEEERNDLQTGFLSNAPEGATKYTRRSPALARLRKVSEKIASDDLGGKTEARRAVGQRLGPFSGYEVRGDIRGNDDFGSGGMLTVSVFGREQIERGLTQHPALSFTISEDGELGVNGPPPGSNTFKEFQKLGWADFAKGADGKPVAGWTSLISPNTKDGKLPIGQVLGLLADVRARTGLWMDDEFVGLHWNRATGSLGGLTLDDNSTDTWAYFSKSRFSTNRDVVDPEPGMKSFTVQVKNPAGLPESGAVGTSSGDTSPTPPYAGFDGNIAPKEGGIKQSTVRTQTDTPEFKRWFGDSKVVDSNGNPLVVYHGTHADFSEFDPLKTGTASDSGWYGDGFYFTPDPKEASDGYAFRSTDANVMPVYLTIKNPYDWRSENQRGLTQNAASASLEKRAELQARGFDGVFVYDDKVQLGKDQSLTDEQKRLFEVGHGNDINTAQVFGWEFVENSLRRKEWDFQIIAQAYGYEFANSLSKSTRTLKEVVAFSPTQIKSATGNNGQFDGSNPDIRYSLPRQSQWYYSNLAKQVEAAPEKIFTTAKQVSLWLQSNKAKLGIKDDELQWTGVLDWLATQQRVTKADVLAYLDANGVQVQEVVHNDGDAEDSIRRASNLGRQLRDAEEALINAEDLASISAAHKERIPALREKVDSLRENYNRVKKEAEDADAKQIPTRYSQYVLPGGSNYRELLLTLPSEADINYRLQALQSEMDIIRRGRLPEDMPADDGSRFDEVLGEYDALKKKRDTLFRSSHWEEPNILAHIRFNDRTDADGARVLFLEELQGDWQQEYRKQSDLIADAVDKDFLGIVKRMEADGVLEVNCD